MNGYNLLSKKTKEHVRGRGREKRWPRSRRRHGGGQDNWGARHASRWKRNFLGGEGGQSRRSERKKIHGKVEFSSGGGERRGEFIVGEQVLGTSQHSFTWKKAQAIGKSFAGSAPEEREKYFQEPRADRKKEVAKKRRIGENARPVNEKKHEETRGEVKRLKLKGSRDEDIPQKKEERSVTMASRSGTFLRHKSRRKIASVSWAKKKHVTRTGGGMANARRPRAF